MDGSSSSPGYSSRSFQNRRILFRAREPLVATCEMWIDVVSSAAWGGVAVSSLLPLVLARDSHNHSGAGTVEPYTARGG